MNDIAAQTVAPASFPIVGIGASAGGLEAISELVARIPAQCGMAFLVVQHLDPQRSSLLSDILATRTALAVTEAVDGVRVEVDHLYVIPPNTSMSIESGCLKLAARSRALGPPTPIDDLFESLAKDQGPNGIGIILSGSGSDGAIGLQTLHNVGAITFAQDESAKFTSMPRAVRSLGCVDLVLPPASIANELMRIASHPYLSVGSPAAGKPDPQFGEDELRHMFLLLKRECNIDFGNYKRGTIYRRVARRLAIRNIETVAQYNTVLEQEPAEVQALCRDLLIRFTQFFRDPEVFTTFAETVFSRFAAAGDADDPIRIWVAGCASGEEVYSLAICLLEYLSEHAIHRGIQIFGTDVSDDALETARAGRYIENIARNVSPERLQKFFVREDDYYRVSRVLRDCCTFARQNVAQDPPFSRMDLITCRNLLIYLDPSLQRRVIPLLHYALKPQGVLILGLSESVGSTSEMFTSLGSQRFKFFCKKPLLGRTNPIPALDFQANSQRNARPAGPAQSDANERFHRQVDRVALEKYAPPCVLCDEEMNVVEFRGDTTAYLFNRPGVPTTQLRNLARPGLVVALTEALQHALRERVAVRKGNLRVDSADGVREVNLLIVPVPAVHGEGRWFLVFFEGSALKSASENVAEPAWWASIKALLPGFKTSKPSAPRSGTVQSELDRLTEELRATREHITTIVDEHELAIQELKSSEEEMLSSNEEFQSTNEELETAKEELQSLNEELSTTNDELGYRNRELKTLNEQVVEARDYANAIVETTSEPMLVLRSDFRVVRANRAFYDCFHVTPAETMQASLYSLGAGQWDQAPLRRLLDELSPEKSRINGYEVRANFPTIGPRVMRLNAVHLAWEAHSLILLTVLDVTDRHKALDSLRTTDRQKDEFLAMLGHELRNPLAAMRNALTLWRLGDKDETTQAYIISVFERQVTNQVRLVEDLLDVSRITRGVVGLRVDRVDLAEIVKGAYESIGFQIHSSQLAAALLVPPGPLWVTGDPMRLEQVVMNVMGNAVKYTPAGGTIEVTLERIRDEAVLTVTDSGIGLSAEFLPTIFDVFVQGPVTAGKGLSGLGIGLALVRRLVKLHGGSVKAESAGLNKGSTFRIRIPALPQVPDHAHSLTPSGDEEASKRSRILLVDDNMDALLSSAEILRIYGHEVEMAADGAAALKKAGTFLPDLVLLDIGLPGMDGYEVCRQLRKNADLQGTVIVANTGFGQDSDRQKSKDAGFDHHLVKPIDLAFVCTLAKRFTGGQHMAEPEGEPLSLM